jgi:hypothetical protein
MSVLSVSQERLCSMEAVSYVDMQNAGYKHIHMKEETAGEHRAVWGHEEAVSKCKGRPMLLHTRIRAEVTMLGESSSSLPHWTSCRFSLRHREVRLLASVRKGSTAQPASLLRNLRIITDCPAQEEVWSGAHPASYIHWVPRTVSAEAKRSERRTDHSHPSSAKVKECVELYLHSLPHVFMT